MPKERRKYERVADKAKKGRFALIDPLDYILLGELPDEGTLMGGYFPITATVESLRKKYAQLSPDQISGRLRTMQDQGLTIIKAIPGGRGWQRTGKGKEVFEKWQTNQRGS